MYNNDYIIAVDENGSPYIAHAYATDGKGRNTRQGIRSGFKAGIGPGLRAAWGSLSGRKPKYDRKEFKNGRWNYIYDEAKKAAKKAWASKAGRFIDEHDAGLSERLMANRQRRKAKQADKAGRHQEAEERRAKAMSLYRESKDEGARAKRTLAAAPKRAWGSKAGRFIDEHDAGASERLMANYYRRKAKQADKSQAEEYRARAMSLYREGKDEGTATRERLKNLTTRKKKEVTENSQKNDSSSSKTRSDSRTSHQKNITGTANEGWSAKREMSDGAKNNTNSGTHGSFNRSVKLETYRKGDRDFNDSNYKESNRIGDTDFFAYKRSDGTSVILEEDMKWVLPKGVDANSPEIKQAIRKFASQVESARAQNKDTYSIDQWQAAVTDAIENAVRKTRKN